MGSEDTQIFDHASQLERHQTIVASSGVRPSTAVGKSTNKLLQSEKENKWHSNDNAMWYNRSTLRNLAMRLWSMWDRLIVKVCGPG